MIDVSDVFKQNINQFGKEIAVRITYDNVVIINNDIKSLSFTKKDDMFKSSMRSIDIVLQGNVDLRNKELSIDFGVSFEESDYNYIHFGKFIPLADSIKYSYEKNETSMTCYDKLIDTHVAYDLNLNVSQDGIMVDELLQAICNRFSFTFTNVTYVNKTSIISKENYDLMISMKPTFRDVLDYLAQITASLILVEDSELKLIYPQQSGFVFDGSNLKTLTVSDRLGPFNRISFARTEIKNITDEDGEISEEEQEVTYYREDEVSIRDNGKSEITFNNNPLISDVHLTPIFEKIQGLMYYSYDITSFGFCYFSPLDIVTIQYAGYEYSSMIMNDIITINNGLSESLYAEKESSSADNYIATSSSEKSVNYSSSIHKEIYSEKFKGLYANFQKVDTDILNVNEQLTALSGKIDDLDVGNLEATYAKIDLSNVTTEHVSNLFVKTGLLENATIVDGHITGTLTGVKISGDLIEANTLAVKDLLLEGEDGLIYQINALASGLTQTELSKEIYQQKLNGTDIVAKSITGNQIAANTITADKINVTDLFAQDITATGTITGLALKGGSININDKFIVDTLGNMTAKSGNFTGVVYATDGTFTGIVNATGGTFNDVTANNLTVNTGTFKGDINTNKDVYVGNNLFIQVDEEDWETKGIYFDRDKKIGITIDYYDNNAESFNIHFGDTSSASESQNTIYFREDLIMIQKQNSYLYITNDDVELSANTDLNLSSGINGNINLTPLGGNVSVNSNLYTESIIANGPIAYGKSYLASGWIGFYTDNNRGTRVAYIGNNTSTTDIYFTNERSGSFIFNRPIIIPNNLAVWGRDTSGNNKQLIGVSSSGNLFIGSGEAGKSIGNTNVYAGNTISFQANRLSGSYKAGEIQMFREQSGSYRTLLRPATNGGAYLGTTSFRWNTAFFTNAITNSDLKNKDVIEDFDFKVKDFVMGLEPIAYKRKGDGDTGVRIHIGIGAQTLASHIQDLNLGDLSMVQASIVENGNERPYHGEEIDDSKLSWGINYTELIPYTILMEQDHEHRIQQLEKENIYLRKILRDNNLLGGTV